jgi:hypothetical protein
MLQLVVDLRQQRVPRAARLPRTRDELPEVRQAPGDHDRQAGRGGGIRLLDELERRLEPLLRIEQRGLAPGPVRRELRREHVVVERRDRDRRTVVEDHLDAVDQVLLLPAAGRRRSERARRRGELLQRGVRAARGDQRA